jgi:DNA invertase Pin-like site-specific DNA recombinase
MRTRVVGYARVSTEEQASDGVSLGAQSEKIRAYASLYDLELLEVIVDAGVSAKTLNRPGLNRALDMLAEGKASGLVVAKLDRLSRSVGDWNTLIDGYFGERSGKTLMSVADSIDTRTAAGRLVLNVLMPVSQWERETIAERTRDAPQQKRSGANGPAQSPSAAAWRDDGVNFVADQSEQEAMAAVRQLRAGRYPFAG